MNYRKRILTVLSLSALLFLAIGGVYSCTKIDETIDEAVDSFLKDFYSSGSDLTIEFIGDEAIIADFGDSYLGSNPAVIGVGDIYIKNISRTGPNTWSANIIEGDYSLSQLNSVSYVPTDITLNGTDLSFSNPDKWDISWKKSKKPVPSNPGTGTGGDTIYNKVTDGNVSEGKMHTFNITSGYSKLTFITTEIGVGERNAADLFVSKGTKPTVSGINPYTYAAQCASIKPNRESETCVFTGPSPLSGTWYVLLYGYSTYFSTRLIIIGNK